MAMSKFLVKEKKAPIVGIQRVYEFDNELGASVISEPSIHARGKELWELAVMKKGRDLWNLCYTTPIASDVLHCLTWEEVEHHLYKISKLEKGLY